MTLKCISIIPKMEAAARTLFKGPGVFSRTIFGGLALGAIHISVICLHPLQPVNFRRLEMRYRALEYFSERKRPDIFCFIFGIQMSRLIPLFLNGASVSGVNRRISVSLLSKASCGFSASDFQTRLACSRCESGASGDFSLPLVGMARWRFRKALISGQANL